MAPVHLNQATKVLTICRKTGKFYTQYYYSKGEAGDEYDSNGMFISHSDTEFCTVKNSVSVPGIFTSSRALAMT